MQSTQVTFRMALDEERRFLQEYLTEAWDRFDAHDGVESAYFWRFGNAARHDPPAELARGTVIDDGGVILVLTGEEPSAAIDAERERWDEHSDVLDDVEVTPWSDGPYENAREKVIDNFGDVGGDRIHRLRPIVARTAIELLREFDEDLPAVGEEGPENTQEVGDWVLIHYLMKQNGHDWDDEIDACVKAIGNRAESLVHFYDVDRGVAALDEAIEALEAVREEMAASAETEATAEG